MFFETNNIDVEQKTELKIRKNLDKKKGFQRENKTGNKKDTGLIEKALQLNILMLFLSCNKSKEDRKRKKERKTRNQKKAQKKDQKEERKKITRERQRKSN